jgi:dephospho-CoA kinase
VPIADRFGRDTIAEDGSIDRRALAGIVFADRQALADLDALTHPAVIAAVNERIAHSDAELIAVDAVKLIESGMADDCDSVWLVVCDPAVQKARLMARNGLTRAEAERRIDAQPDEPSKAARADAVIDNNGTPEETRAVVARLWDALPKLPNRQQVLN